MVIYGSIEREERERRNKAIIYVVLLLYKTLELDIGVKTCSIQRATDE